MGLRDKLAGRPRAAKPGEHYVLECRTCDFTHDIPRATSFEIVDFDVYREIAAFQCTYASRFKVRLEVGDFFTMAAARGVISNRQASIVDNMKVLHPHIVSHCDPVYLLIEQSPDRTNHTYKHAPEGSIYVRYSAGQGTDVFGNIDPSKAEIPGISW
jgi:hypothetical protein